MKWLNVKSLIVSAGNPIAFLAVYFGIVPEFYGGGSLIGFLALYFGLISAIDARGNIFHISIFQVVVLIVYGYLYLGMCAILKKSIKKKGNTLDYFGQISTSMFPFSVVGVILSGLYVIEGDGSGVLLFLAIITFTLVWILVSRYAIYNK